MSLICCQRSGVMLYLFSQVRGGARPAPSSIRERQLRPRCPALRKCLLLIVLRKSGVRRSGIAAHPTVLTAGAHHPAESGPHSAVGGCSEPHSRLRQKYLRLVSPPLECERDQPEFRASGGRQLQRSESGSRN